MVYDALHRRTGAAITSGYLRPVALTYAFDALSRRTSMTDSYNGVTAYTYDREDRIAEITTPWNTKITQTYDAAGRPLKLALRRQPLQDSGRRIEKFFDRDGVPGRL